MLNLQKFATALRLRWLWHAWDEPPKTWSGSGTPCTSNDKDLFAAATRVCIGDGNKAKFWESPWLDGLRPKDIAPKIFELSKKKMCLVRKALDNNLWVRQIDTRQGLTLDHIQQFATLWEMLADVNLNQGSQDTISWKFTNSGEYSASSAYMVQFVGLSFCSMNATIWKMWAPPKIKFFFLCKTEFYGKYI